MSGVDATGFTQPTFEEIKADFESTELTLISPSMNQSASSYVGQWNGIQTEALTQLYELLGLAFDQFNPNAAESVYLDNLGQLIGVPRLGEEHSFDLCNLTLGASFSAGPGVMIVSVVGQPTIRFTNRDAVASTTAGVYSNIPFIAIDPGPIPANAGTLTVITPISGWTACTNPLNATPGRFVETDEEYRLRMDQLKSAQGSGTLPGIRAELLRIPGIQQAFVFENATDATDGDGVPPHAIECVIFDGPSPTVADNTIALAIWKNKPSGIATYGSTSGTITDDTGAFRNINFSRATPLTLYLEYDDVDVNVSLFPNAVADVKAAAVSLGQHTFAMGTDVIALKFKAAALGVAGVADVGVLKLGFAPAPAGTVNLTVTPRQIAFLTATNIAVFTTV